MPFVNALDCIARRLPEGIVLNGMAAGHNALEPTRATLPVLLATIQSDSGGERNG